MTGHPARVVPFGATARKHPPAQLGAKRKCAPRKGKMGLSTEQADPLLATTIFKDKNTKKRQGTPAPLPNHWMTAAFPPDRPSARPASSMNCRPGCAACCIAPSISSPIPGMPRGKPAGVPCVQLDAVLGCRLFGDPARPAVCGGLQPSAEMCGTTREQAIAWLANLERASAPADVPTPEPPAALVGEGTPGPRRAHYSGGSGALAPIGATACTSRP